MDLAELRRQNIWRGTRPPRDRGLIESQLCVRKLRKNAAVACVFCGEQTGGKNNNREQHIGRHMEEIAFAVVRKPYEEWDFYSDSSGLAYHDITSDSDPRANT